LQHFDKIELQVIVAEQPIVGTLTLLHF